MRKQKNLPKEAMDYLVLDGDTIWSGEYLTTLSQAKEVLLDGWDHGEISKFAVICKVTPCLKPKEMEIIWEEIPAAD